MCKKLMNHKSMFLQNFLEIMTSLKDDKVLNVKLLLVQTLRDHIDSKGPLSEENSIKKLVEELKKDDDEEIRDVFE